MLSINILVLKTDKKGAFYAVFCGLGIESTGKKWYAYIKLKMHCSKAMQTT